MANAFKNKGKTLTDAALTEVFAAHAAGVAETVIHSLTVCNTGSVSVNADITVEDVSASGTPSYYIAKTTPVPANSSLVFSDIKLNLESGDKLHAKSSNASGNLDIFASILEIS
jgi:hypothetical protein